MDNELDELLDSALADFDKKPSNVTIERTNLTIESDSKSSTEKNATTQNDTKTAQKLFDENEMKLFDEIFNDEATKQSMKQFANLLQNDTKLNENTDPKQLFDDFEKIMSNLMSTNDLYDDDDYDDDNDDVVDSKKEVNLNLKSNKTDHKDEGINKILEDMNKKTENLLKDKELPSMFNPNSDNFNDDELTFMQPLISMLFSKEILHPSLKMMLENYNKYLNDNKQTLENTDEYKKCVEQKEYIIKMCEIYENSGDNDTEEVKSNQLKQILELLEKCGHPPKELVPDMNPFENIGDFMKTTSSCPIS